MPEPRYSITYKRSAATALRKIDRQHHQTIMTAIDALAQQHPCGRALYKYR